MRGRPKITLESNADGIRNYRIDEGPEGVMSPDGETRSCETRYGRIMIMK